MPLNPNGNLVGTSVADLLWGRALVLGDGSYDNYSDTGNPGALYGYGGNDTIYGDIYYDGDDGIEGDEAYGGDGHDLIYGDTGPQAGAGWQLNLIGSSDRLWGDAGNDTIYGEHGNDQIDGGTGNDLLVGGRGSDALRGGAGNDTIWVDLRQTLISEGWYNSAWGGAGDDIVWGGAGVDEVYGDAGNDQIQGLGGNDDLEGGNGRDTLYGGEGDDRLDGGGYYATADSHDLLLGREGNDTLIGDAGDDTLAGEEGTDALSGGEGDDVYVGGAGADTYDCGAGNDTYYIEQRSDRLRFDYADSGRDLIGSAINWTLGNYQEDLELIYEDDLTGRGNAGGNRITGNEGANRLLGLGGNDTILGGVGNDQLLGGSGKDQLSGGAGSDTLTGNAAADRLTGDGGADRFVFLSRSDSTVASAGRDTITDFTRGQGDRIVLTAIDADTGARGNQAFDFIGGAGFSGDAGELRVQVSGSGRLIQGDVTGDGVADFAIYLDDALNVGASYFDL